MEAFPVQMNVQGLSGQIIMMTCLPHIGEVIRFGAKPLPEGHHYEVLGVTHVLTRGGQGIAEHQSQVGVIVSVIERFDGDQVVPNKWWSFLHELKTFWS